MVDISGIGSPLTPNTHQDQLRPDSMLEADDIVKLLASTEKLDASGAVTFSAALSAIVTSTRGTKIDELWAKVESLLNKGRDLEPTASKSSIEQIKTTVGIFYSLLNIVDQESNANLVRQFRSAYQVARSHVEDRFLSQMDETEQNLTKRIIRITDKRLNAVVKRVNKAIRNGEVPGPEL